MGSRYPVAPFRPSVFGVPFLIRFQPDIADGLELYNLVIANVKRFIRCRLPLTASRASSSLSHRVGMLSTSDVDVKDASGAAASKRVVDSDEDSDADTPIIAAKGELIRTQHDFGRMRCRDLLKLSLQWRLCAYGPSHFHAKPACRKRQARFTHAVGILLVCALTLAEFVVCEQIETLQTWGFVLRIVSASGEICSTCPWYSKCSGCPIFPDAPKGFAWREGFIVVDWDPVCVHLNTRHSWLSLGVVFTGCCVCCACGCVLAGIPHST